MRIRGTAPWSVVLSLILNSACTSASSPAAAPPAAVDAGGDTATIPATESGVTPADGAVPAKPGVVGVEGIAAWDALAVAERDAILGFRSFFLHQSVGGDLEDGANALGYKFEYTESTATGLSPGLNGGLFKSSNGDGAGKIVEFSKMALANKSTVRVAIMKFGYADIVEDKLAATKGQYLAAVTDIKAAGVRVLHVTPPFVYGAPSENSPKMAMRTWMLETFTSDVIFDLEAIESIDPASGARCERGGSWEICDSVRSTTACPSLNQGIDAPTGQGHICHAQAKRISKAFLHAIYLSGR